MFGSPAEFLQKLLAKSRLLCKTAMSRTALALACYDAIAREIKNRAVPAPNPFDSDNSGLDINELPMELCFDANTSRGRQSGIRAYITFLILEWLSDPTVDFSAFPSQRRLLQFCRFMRFAFPKRKKRGQPSPFLAIGSCYNYLHGVYELFLRTYGRDIFHRLPQTEAVDAPLEVPSLLLKLRERWKSERNAHSESSFAFSVQQRNIMVKRCLAELKSFGPLSATSSQLQWDLETFLAAFLVACRMGLRVSHYGATYASVNDPRRLLILDHLEYRSTDESCRLSALDAFQQMPTWLCPRVPPLPIVSGFKGLVTLSWGPRHKALETGTYVTRPLFAEESDRFCAFTVLTCFLLKRSQFERLNNQCPVFARGPNGPPVDGLFMNKYIRHFISGVGESGEVVVSDQANLFSSQSCRSFYLTMALEKGIPEEIALAYGQWAEKSRVGKRVYHRATSERFRQTVDVLAEPLLSPMRQRRRR